MLTSKRISFFFVFSFFLAGLLQPPVRIVSQPQPARRLDPPSRFSGRNDRGDTIPNRKDDRRCVANDESTCGVLRMLCLGCSTISRKINLKMIMVQSGYLPLINY